MFVKKKLKLFLVFGSGVLLGVCTANRELNAIAFELFTVRDRAHGSGVLIQKINLFER